MSKKFQPIYDEQGRLRVNELGETVCDPKPIAAPAGFGRVPTMEEQFARFLRYREYAEFQKLSETPEEANDFDCGQGDDGFGPTSPHEEAFPGQFEQMADFEKNRKKYVSKARRLLKKHSKPRGESSPPRQEGQGRAEVPPPPAKPAKPAPGGSAE